ncbi:cyclic peptide export ABC transporter [Teredinibacter turnerae]|uniref:cyclic peptide export ABC transporter n=1 Tax=Teredinibacter turnerae TaxID=2426 RepID=UPI00036AE43E|nr:cyclic peptide export ABC transporter [Teredinibacter turnerae]
MVYQLIRKFRWPLVFATMLSVLSAAFSIGVMVFLNQQISNVGEGTENYNTDVLVFAFALMGLGVFGVLSQYILSRLSAGFTAQLRRFMVENVLNTNYEGIERVGGHRIYASLTSDIRSLASAFSLLPHVAYNSAAVLLCLAYLAYSSWQLFVFVFIFLALAIGFAQVLMNRGMKLLKGLRETDDNLFNSFKALVEGGKELNINTNRKRHFYKDLVVPHVDEIKRKSVHTELNFIFIHNWTNVVLFGVMGSIVFLAQAVFITVPVEVVVGFLLIMIYLVGPISSLMDMYSVVAGGVVASKKINSLELGTHAGSFAENGNSKSSQLNDEWQSLSVQDLTYQYPCSENEIYQFGVGPINLDISRGELVFVTGGNGSGKSTFIKALIGLYTPNSGQIYFDGKCIDFDSDREWYGRHFSAIFSDFYLFQHAIGKDGELASDDVINQYLTKLQLDKKVDVQGGELSSVSLSHGQKKRLALLLSYIEDTSIYIFDEWAADQDPYFRKYFYMTLLPELKSKGKTVIAITHDDAYFHTADRVLKFESGLLVEVTENDGKSFASSKVEAVL